MENVHCTYSIDHVLPEGGGVDHVLPEGGGVDHVIPEGE